MFSLNIGLGYCGFGCTGLGLEYFRFGLSLFWLTGLVWIASFWFSLSCSMICMFSSLVGLVRLCL